MGYLSKYALVTVLLLFVFLRSKGQETDVLYNSDNLSITRLTTNTLTHISYLDTDSFGKVACNGMIAIDNGEAIIFDTPTNDEATNELIAWLESSNYSIKGVVATHFHEDCLGGLGAFHNKGIPSYGSNLTLELAKSNDLTAPQSGFDDYLELEIGNEIVVCEYFGEGHTRDNVIGYFPSEKVLFGGCLIKSEGAGKGYLGDANVEMWPKTVMKLKTKYPQVETVVPGHGSPAGPVLLDFTIDLFDN